MSDENLLIGQQERKARLKDIFEDTLLLLKQDEQLSADTKKAMSEAEFYPHDSNLSFANEKHKTHISATNERTFEAARRLLSEKDGKVAVLNFANSIRPGGGVFGGSSAQEESLCRCSNLYPVIEQDRFRKLYYKPNRFKANDTLATDDIIYARDVTVFKSDDDFPELLPKDEWYKVDVITCAAPNLIGAEEIGREELVSIHHFRARRIFRSALAHNVRRIVLGAFGCGAFRNNPECVARGFELAIKDFEGQFEEIVFAIYHQPNELRNFQIFAQVFEGKTIDYNLGRFIEAQDKYYDIALAEISASQKRSHWIWYIFPQLAELGYSYNSKYYGISGIEEARAYLNNPTLKKHLLEICGKLYECDGDIAVIMGNLDSLKLLSCMTLFNATDPSIEIFQKIIDKFYAGQKDRRTLKILGVE